MTPGDLIEYGDRRWLVGLRHRETRTYTIYSARGSGAEIEDDADKIGSCKVICNPSQEWPLLSLKSRNWGPISMVSVPGYGRQLEVMVDWVPGNPGRDGGNVFMNPSLGLRVGDTVSIAYASGRATRYTVPFFFSTVPQKIARATEKPHEPKTIFDHMLEEDEES
jgi:hypothetical protein